MLPNIFIQLRECTVLDRIKYTANLPQASPFADCHDQLGWTRLDVSSFLSLRESVVYAGCRARRPTRARQSQATNNFLRIAGFFSLPLVVVALAMGAVDWV
jgi:hypothetical protein